MVAAASRRRLRGDSHIDSAPPPRIIISPGEPAGIGPDICIQLAQQASPAQLVVAADPDLLKERCKMLNIPLQLHPHDGRRMPHQPGHLFIKEFKLARETRCGQPDTQNADYVLDILRYSVAQCLAENFDAMVTGPVQKSLINDAGIDFTGHTEFLADLTSTTAPVMLLVADELRVALATTHLPLSEVSASLDTRSLVVSLETLHGDLQQRFGIAEPRILVCGLNPHAGEQGHLGHEDDQVIAPAVDELRRQGMDIRGPLPADTVFTPSHLKGAHAVMAMYHDQGLPVLKYAGFGRAVNVTLGLPIVRTSVDHGTAFDLAGSGKADPGSLKAAVALAAELISRRVPASC